VELDPPHKRQNAPDNFCLRFNDLQFAWTA